MRTVSRGGGGKGGAALVLTGQPHLRSWKAEKVERSEFDELGEFDVSLSLGAEGESPTFRVCMGADRLVELQGHLREEVGGSVFEKNDLEKRLSELSSRKASRADAAETIESWLGWLVDRDMLRRTASLRAFVDGEGDGFDDEVTVASFLLMGAEARSATFSPAKGERLAAKLGVKSGETVAWSWTTACRERTRMSRRLCFRALFAAHSIGSDEERLEFPALDVSPSNAAVVVDQDEENKTWEAENEGTLYLIWVDVQHKGRRSRSLLPASGSTTNDVDVALKIAKCGAGAAVAARTAAAEAREQRQLESFGERLRVAPASSCLVRVLAVGESSDDRRDELADDERQTLTGLHVRANLRKAAARLGALTEVTTSSNAASGEGRLRGALEAIAALEDEAAGERARADRASASVEVERERADAERRSARAERERLASAHKAAEDRAIRAEARVAAAVGALKALEDYELAGDYDDSDDRVAYNPFVGRDTKSDRTWASLLCGDDDVDMAAANARRAAARCASACSRARLKVQELEQDKKKLAEEKRVLIAELRRLRAAADDKVAEARADADEARMIQRQFATHLKKLKEERRVLARRLANSVCASSTQDDSSRRPSAPDRPLNDGLDDDGAKMSTPPRVDPDESQHPNSTGRRDHEVDDDLPPKDLREDRKARRAALEAKLHGCREYVCSPAIVIMPNTGDNALLTLS